MHGGWVADVLPVPLSMHRALDCPRCKCRSGGVERCWCCHSRFLCERTRRQNKANSTRGQSVVLCNCASQRQLRPTYRCKPREEITQTWAILLLRAMFLTRCSVSICYLAAVRNCTSAHVVRPHCSRDCEEMQSAAAWHQREAEHEVVTRRINT
jgi:hypothetical protein